MSNLYRYKARIYNIVDGDTFDADVDLGFYLYAKLRFKTINVNTPETWRPNTRAEEIHGELATEKAKELLLDKEVILNVEGSGKYGRWLTEIILDKEEEHSYSDELVNKGYYKLSEEEYNEINQKDNIEEYLKENIIRG